MNKTLSAVLICPQCSHEIQATIEVKAEAMSVDQMPKHKLPREERFSSYEVALLNTTEQAGVLTAFCAATRAAKGTQTPKDLDRFFLTYVRTCAAVTVPRSTLNVLIDQFDGANITCHATQGIVMVLADGRPALFAPEAFARISPSRLEKRNAVLPDVDTAGLVEWIRTRNGYVASRGLLWQELKGKSAGHFARPSL